MSIDLESTFRLNSQVPLWFAVSAKFRSEKFVCKQLTKKGITAYVPLQKRVKKYNRKSRIYDIPVINCYVFVKITMAEYIKVLDTPYVNYFIKSGNDIKAIRQEEIDILKKICGTDLEVQVRPYEFHAGMQVRINSGNLTGLKGVIISKAGKKEFLINLENLGLQLQLQVNESILEPMLV